jgi:K+-sensing histidine kinase KdpD
VIHDLRNPLSAIAGNLQLLQGALEGKLEPKNSGRLQACLTSLDELNGMLADLQYLVLIRSGELEVAYKEADVRALTLAVTKSATTKSVQGQTVVTLLDGPAPCIPVMAQLVTRAIQNLVISALRICKASPVTVQLEDRAGEHVNVMVTYTGLSVPPPLSENLFELNCTHRQQQHGLRVERARTLYFVRSTAEFHGGGVRYEQLPDGGRFYLQLPYKPSKRVTA